MGDSVQRGMYKDLVALCNDGWFMTDDEKRAKGEPSYRGDRLLNISKLTNNTNFTEVREFVGYRPHTDEEKGMSGSGDYKWTNSILIRFVFITRAWNKYVNQAFDIVTSDYFPDVICINSTFWDISRWNEDGKDVDKDGRPFYPILEQNVQNLTKHINMKALDALKRHKIDRPCLKIWRAAMPIGKEAKGGLVKKELDFGTESYREDIARSNLNLVPIIRKAGWDLLDAQFWFRTVQDDYREDDGIHWTAVAHRYLSNIFLTHISESWGIGWPSYPCKDSHGYVKNMFNGVPMSELRDCVKEYEEQTGYDPRPKMQDNFKKDNNAARLY